MMTLAYFDKYLELSVGRTAGMTDHDLGEISGGE